VGSLRESATRIQERSEAIQTSTRQINEAVESVHSFSSETKSHIDEVEGEARRVAEEQRSIAETGEKSNANIEQLMTELKYFAMERDEAGGDSYDAEMKAIILDHKKRVIGARALLDGRVDLEHIPQPDPATSCLLSGWLDRAERGNLDPETISALREDHESFHQRYNELIAAYRSGDTERARGLLEEAETYWRKLVGYRETFSGILQELKAGGTRG
jgi:hypothetical protein